MNILDLPRDLLLEVWSYVTRIEDLLRFGATCRRIQELAFEVKDRRVRTEYVKKPFGVNKNILSRDLRQLRELSIGNTDLPSNEELDWIGERLTILTTLHNLKKLGIRFVQVFAYTQSVRRKELNLPTFRQRVSEIVQKMTWLERLRTSLPEDTNYRVLFKNHQKLTKLELLTRDKGTGYNYLTQLRSISLPVSTKDEIFHQLLELDNLTAIDMSWTLITLDSANKISQLTNLVKINIGGLDTSISWKIIKMLPKLKTLIDDRPSIANEEFDALNEMTQLTRLEIDTEEKLMSTEKFSNLTNLRELQFTSTFCTPGTFENFKHLTSLQLKNFEEDAWMRFPQLKLLDMTDCYGVVPLEIFTIDSLEDLRVYWAENTDTSNMLQISRLTNLKALHVRNHLPNGVGNSLKVLANLRRLWMKEISSGDIEELKLVTQLCKLIYVEADVTIRTIKEQLPFIVYKQ